MKSVAFTAALVLSTGLTLGPQRPPEEPRKFPEPGVHVVSLPSASRS